MRRGEVCITYLPRLRRNRPVVQNTTHDEDYVNPPVDGVLSWRSIISCINASYIGLKNSQKRLHEVSTRRCERIDYAVRWIGTKIKEPPME
jgi:hypothetical protein